MSRVNTSLQPYSNNKREISIPHWARYLPYWLQPMRRQYFPSRPITGQENVSRFIAGTIR